MNELIKYLKSINCTNIVFLLSLLATTGNAKLRELQTTRLMSTSGTGIASILTNESAVLNPASIYFFNASNIYYQKGSSSIEEKSSLRELDGDAEHQMLVITDTTSQLKGSFSFQTQEQGKQDRKRITSSASTNLGKNASFGVLYRYTEEDVDGHRVYHQGIFGLTYMYNERLSFGAILADPFLANKEDTRLAGGVQFSIAQNFIAMADIGVNYTDSPETQNFVRAAVQAQFFRDLFLKYGQYKDKIDKLEGVSWGLSWIGPRISFEYALKESRALETTELLFEDEEVQEQSFAISMVF
tara:strand:- start:31728 stop:32624 length:897 start_codon:yes stop_codon:yes gene_type:complete